LTPVGITLQPGAHLAGSHGELRSSQWIPPSSHRSISGFCEIRSTAAGCVTPLRLCVEGFARQPAFGSILGERIAQ